MDKQAIYYALQELARSMAQGGRDGFNEGDQENYIAQARALAQQAGLDPNAIENWLGQAAGGMMTTDVPGMGTPEEVARSNFARGESADTLGLTLEQMAKDTGSTLKDGFLSEATIPKDYMLGDNSSFLQNAIKFAGLAAAGYGLGTGLEGLIGGATGAGAGAGAISDPFMQAFTPDLASTGMFSGAEAATFPAWDPSILPGDIAPIDTGISTAEAAANASGIENPLNFPQEAVSGNFSQLPVENFPSPLSPQGVGQSLLDNNQIINNVAQTGGNAGVPGLLSNAGAGLGLPAAAGTTAAASQLGFWDQISKGFFPDGSKIADMAKSPTMQGVGSLISAYLRNQENNKLQQQTNAAADRGDPFGSQRPFYQGRLMQSYLDPNFFQNDPVFSGIRRTAMNDVERAAAARGYNNSSNVLHNVGSRINDEGMKYANLFQGQLGQFAGAGVSPGTSAQIQAQGAQAGQQSGNATNADYGEFLKNIPGMMKQFGLV